MRPQLRLMIQTSLAVGLSWVATSAPLADPTVYGHVRLSVSTYDGQCAPKPTWSFNVEQFQREMGDYMAQCLEMQRLMQSWTDQVEKAPIPPSPGERAKMRSDINTASSIIQMAGRDIQAAERALQQRIARHPGMPNIFTDEYQRLRAMHRSFLMLDLRLRRIRV